jgi:hypothetical protein
VNALLTWLEKSDSLQPSMCVACLQAFRIFSREKSNMESLTSERALRLLIRIAGIEYYATENEENVTIQDGNQDGNVQALCSCYGMNRVSQIQLWVRRRRRRLNT